MGALTSGQGITGRRASRLSARIQGTIRVVTQVDVFHCHNACLIIVLSEKYNVNLDGINNRRVLYACSPVHALPREHLPACELSRLTGSCTESYFRESARRLREDEKSIHLSKVARALSVSGVNTRPPAEQSARLISSILTRSARNTGAVL